MVSASKGQGTNIGFLVVLLLSQQEKAALKAQKDAAEARYKVAYVDGRPEQVREHSWCAQTAAAATPQQLSWQ